MGSVVRLPWQTPKILQRHIAFVRHSAAILVALGSGLMAVALGALHWPWILHMNSSLAGFMFFGFGRPASSVAS